MEFDAVILLLDEHRLLLNKIEQNKYDLEYWEELRDKFGQEEHHKGYAKHYERHLQLQNDLVAVEKKFEDLGVDPKEAKFKLLNEDYLNFLVKRYEELCEEEERSKKEVFRTKSEAERDRANKREAYLKAHDYYVDVADELYKMEDKLTHLGYDFENKKFKSE